MAEKEKKKKKPKKARSFEKELLMSETPYNVIVSVYMFFYLSFFSGLYLDIGLQKFIYFSLAVAAIVVVLQLFLAPFTNHLAVGKTSKLADSAKDENFGIEERTQLVKSLMSCAKRMMANVGCVFALGILAGTLICYYFFTKNLYVVMFWFASGIVNSYIAAIVGYIYTETFCSKRAIPLVISGVDAEEIQKDKFFGYSLFSRMIVNICIPIILLNGMTLLYYMMRMKQNLVFNTVGIYGVQATTMIILLAVNVVVSIIFASFVYWQISNSYKQINIALEKILENVNEDVFLTTDLSNDFSYNYFLINEIVVYLHDLVTNMLNTSNGILNATNELSVVARKNSETSLEESSSVKNCLAAMDGLNSILTQISDRIYNVNIVAGNTKIDIDEGYDLLRTEIIEKKINEIINSNIDTIFGIKLFSEKIGKVWDIIDTIDEVANKTKIIAFNAELEATEAGENGDAYHIIANEVRRLATTTIDSTQRIKSYIKTIQNFSDNLIVTSEVGTQKVREGSAFFSGLEEKFSDLRTATDITAESAVSIQELTGTQDTAFEQINVTFQQISLGFDQLSKTARYISDIAEDLRNISVQLETVTEQSAQTDVEEEDESL